MQNVVANMGITCYGIPDGNFKNRIVVFLMPCKLHRLYQGKLSTENGLSILKE